MSGLVLTVTNAGRAALVNAQHNGTLPVMVASVGVTASTFPTDTASLQAMTELPGEIKRVATISGGTTGADTIHVTVNDSSSDTYSVFGLGVRLADGTLFAVYGQATALLQKSSQATMLLAFDVQFTDIAATSLTFGDTNFQLSQATTDQLGVIQLATDAEAIAGTDQNKAVVPHALKATLDDRLGAGAPSTFVKTLLGVATAALFRTALALKSAATFDVGAGNGLDADLLDGQQGAYYRAWANLTGVPATFPPSAHTQDISTINGLQAALNALAPLNAPAFTGIATVPTAANGTNSLQIANTAFVQAAIAALINGSPGALDTLKELADAMGDDPNFAATVTNALAGKLPLTGGTLSGLLGISSAGVQFNNGGYWATMRADPSGIVGMINKAGSTWNWSVDDNGNTSQRGSLNTTGGLHVVGGQTLPGTQGQGSYLSWNVTNGWGDMSFINHHGGGSGGWGFYDTDGTTYTRTITFSRTGDGTFSGTLYSNTNFLSTNNYWVAGTNGAGTILLRPNGVGSTSGQLELDSNGNTYVAGALTATGGFQISDRNTKTNIKRRDVQRGIALIMARMFCEWDRIADGVHDVGLIAQGVKRVASRYVMQMKRKMGQRRGTLAIDKAGIALECSMDNALSIEEHRKAMAAMMRRIEKLERRK